MREPLNSHRSHQANAPAIPSSLGCRTVLLRSHASSRCRLDAGCSRLTQPLCSSRITGLHRSYGLVRPASSPWRACIFIVSASASGSGYLSSVRSPHGFRQLYFSLKRTFTVSGKRSLSHPSPGSRSSAQEPGPGSRPLYAGCRTPSNQVSGALIPEV